MKTFSIEEANEMIPRVRPVLKRMSAAFSGVLELHEPAKAAAAAAATGGGGMPNGGRYIQLLEQLAEGAGRLEELGIQIKDYKRGLIDFPSIRDGKIVLLCWQLGEGDSIEWWHEADAGFAGRQPL